MKALRKYRIVLIVLCTALMCGIRILSVYFGVDAVSGYTSSVLWTVIQIVAGVFVACICVLPQLTDSSTLVFHGRTVFSRIACAAATLAFLVKSVIRINNLITDIASRTSVVFSIPWAELIQTVLLLISVCFFLVLYVNGFELKHKAALLLIIGPLGYYAVRLVADFMTLTMHPAISAYSLSLLALGLTLLFLTKFGRLLHDRRIGRSYSVFAALSALSVGFAMVSSLILLLAGNSVYQAGFDWSDLVCDFGILLLIFACYGLVDHIEKTKEVKGGSDSAEKGQDQLLP